MTQFIILIKQMLRFIIYKLIDSHKKRDTGGFLWKLEKVRETLPCCLI